MTRLLSCRREQKIPDMAVAGTGPYPGDFIHGYHIPGEIVLDTRIRAELTDAVVRQIVFLPHGKDLLSPKILPLRRIEEKRFHTIFQIIQDSLPRRTAGFIFEIPVSISQIYLPFFYCIQFYQLYLLHCFYFIFYQISLVYYTINNTP